MLRFLLLAIALIVYGSLFPFRFALTPAAAHPVAAVWNGWPAEWDRYILRDVVLNVLLYVMPGFAVAMIAMRRHSPGFAAAAAIAFSFALSVAMELLQVYIPSRDPSSLDVLTNTCGGAMGGAFAVLVAPHVRSFRLRIQGPGLVLLVVWAVYEFFPLLPDIGRTHLSESFFALVHFRGLTIVDIWLGVGEWLALAVCLEAAFGRVRTLWVAIVIATAILAQAAILDRTPNAWEVISAAIALPLWHFAPKASRTKWCAWVFATGLLLHQLQPFYFLSVPQTFSWDPFAATLQSSRVGAVVIIARKAFDYGAMVFVLARMRWHYAGAAIAVAAGLAATEALQTYLPGRTPEVTDPLVALLMAVLLAIFTPRKAQA